MITTARQSKKIVHFFCSTGKPLAPQNVVVNITKDGYWITWSHSAVPGRPIVEKFVVEFSEGNGSSPWRMADAAVPADRKKYLFSAEKVEAEKTYEFRVFAFGANEFSEAAYVSKTYKLGEFLIIILSFIKLLREWRGSALRLKRI